MTHINECRSPFGYFVFNGEPVGRAKRGRIPSGFCLRLLNYRHFRGVESTDQTTAHIVDQSLNVCNGGHQTNNISLVPDGSNLSSCGSPTPPSPGSDYSCSSDTSLQPDTFSIHFRNMHDKLLLGDRYLEDLIYNFLEMKSKVDEREWWLLEACRFRCLPSETTMFNFDSLSISGIVNLDYLSWLDDTARTELQNLIPKSPLTPEAISQCEVFLGVGEL